MFETCYGQLFLVWKIQTVYRSIDPDEIYRLSYYNIKTEQMGAVHYNKRKAIWLAWLILLSVVFPGSQAPIIQIEKIQLILTQKIFLSCPVVSADPWPRPLKNPCLNANEHDNVFYAT